MTTTDPKSPAVESKAKEDKFTASTRVDVAVILPGNAGLNNAEIFIPVTPPAKSPGMTLVPVDANGPLLKERFSDAPKKKLRNLMQWMQSGRFFPLQMVRNQAAEKRLRENPAPSDGEVAAGEITKSMTSRLKLRRHRKLFGAGGDPDAGHRAALSVQSKLDQIIKNQDLVISWGAGGGGVGTAVLRLVAELAEKHGIPLINILITPDKNEGNKVAIADQLRKDLRKGNVLVIKNSDVPDDERNVTLRELHQAINEKIRPIFKTFDEITQVVGQSDVDLEDLITLLTLGHDLSLGYYVASAKSSKTEAQGPDDEREELINKAIESLTKPPLQNHGLVAQGAIFCFHGDGWLVSMQDKIVDGVIGTTPSKGDMFVKKHVVSAKGPMWVSVLMSGEFPESVSDDAQKKIEPSSQVAAPIPVQFASVEENGSPWGQLHGRFCGTPYDFKAPPDLIKRWQDEIQRRPPVLDNLENLQVEFRQREYSRRAPDLPDEVRLLPKGELVGK